MSASSAFVAEPAGGPESDRTTGRLPIRLREGFASEREEERVISWLETGLRPGRTGRLCAEYPLLLGPQGSGIPLIAFEPGGQPIAFALLWPVRFEVDGASLHAGMISLVYTDPRRRGEGLARRVVEAAVERARTSGLGVVLLWSDLEGLYAPLGFTRIGCETLVLIEPDTLERARAALARGPGHGDAPVVRPGEPGDWKAIEALRRDRRCRVDLPFEQFARFASVPDLVVRVAVGREGLEGFAICGRGDDLREVIHDWGGSGRAVLACCEALISELAPDRGLFLLAPDAPIEPAWPLRRAGARMLRQPLAWMRIADPDSLARDLMGLLGRRPGLHAVVGSSAAEPRLRIEGDGSMDALELDGAALLRALFGASAGFDPESTRAALLERLDAPHGTALPLPFFVWGLESI
ncbi:MAG: GNAT family N-acetyltransferase [Myxococcota bacterium]